MNNLTKLTIVIVTYKTDSTILKNCLNSIDKNVQIKIIDVITMEEVIHSIDNQVKIPSKSVLLTFDDAYSDHYMNVFPILDKHQLQGSFYTPSKAITENTILDVNKIHFILASVQDKSDIVSDLKHLLKVYKKEYQLQDFDYYYKN